MVEFRAITSKSVLNRYKHRDNWFWCRYSVNPYRGCQFACNYCDAITEKYLVHDDYEDFSRLIYVKSDAPELLRKELVKAERDVVSLSGVTDPYQPAERKFGVTRKVLEVLRDNDFPVHIGTKSDLVLRDSDILSEISERSWCTVSITVITFDEKLLPLLEPFAPKPERRLEAVRKLTEKGIRAGINFTPIIPYLCDSGRNIRDVVRRASECSARYILPGSGLTIRSNQKLRFLTLLQQNWPHLVERYDELYGGSQIPNKEHLAKTAEKVFKLCRQLEIPVYIEPPHIDRPLRDNYTVANLLLVIAYFKEMKAGNPYSAWAYHRAAESIEGLNRNIRDLHHEDRLREIHGVGEGIAEVITEFLETGRSSKLEKLKEEW